MHATTSGQQRVRKLGRAGRWLGVALIILCGCMLALFHAGARNDEQLRHFRDTLFPRAASGKIVVVEIDARSLAEISSWPWPRSRHGELAEKLRALGAGTIAFDIDFSSHSRPDQDAAFAASLARVGGDVILPTFVQKQSSLAEASSENMPIAELRDHSFAGSVNVQPDPDGQLRTYSYGVTTGGVPRPSIGALLAGGGDGAVDESFRVDTSIDPASVPRVSAIDVFSGRVPRQAVAGKAVVVGATAVEMGDRYVVPGQGILPGVVVQTLAAETLLQGTVNPDRGPWIPLALAALVVVAAAARPDRRLNPVLIAAGFAAVLTLPLFIEQMRWGSMTIVPALTVLGLSTLWSALLRLDRRLREDRLIDGATGLPNARALTRRHQSVGHIMVARIQQWTEISTVLTANERAALIAQIVARIDTAFPDALVHGVQNGVLGWAVEESRIEALTDAAEGACALFRIPIRLEGRSLLVTPVFGIQDATVGAAPALAQALLAAEQAQEGGRRWGVHSAQALTQTDRALLLLGDIGDALANGDIYVLYQPKYQIAEARIAGAEALVRWRHPTLGAIRPDEFIPLLESSGHIAPLSLSVVDQCLADLRRWQDEGHDLGISVNISAALLGDRDFVEYLAGRLEELGALVRHITLEVTESATLDGAETAIAVLERMRALGARVSIDDYGTGNATLSYLKSFPTDEIKIDKSFVTAIETNASDRILVRSTIELAHELGLAVVAEGVEDASCLNLLRSYGCDIAQGWTIGRPMPAAEFLALAAADPVAAVAA